MPSKKISFKGKKILVVGLGISGMASAMYLCRQKARVYVTDSQDSAVLRQRARKLSLAGAEVELGGHSSRFMDGCDYVVKSPGVSWQSTPLRYASKKAITILSEIALGLLGCQAKIIAVTGSNGKTTTCHLIHQIFKTAGKKVILAGNVGYTLLESARSAKPGSYVVLEMSSFQLEDTPSFHPNTAMILNIGRNHLDRHKTFTNYLKAKSIIYQNLNTSDTAVVNADQSQLMRLAQRSGSKKIFFSVRKPRNNKIRCVYVDQGALWFGQAGKRTRIMDLSNARLQGEHNHGNMAAAAAIALSHAIPKRAIASAFRNFKNLEHRVEKVATRHGIVFVNDSKSTTMDATSAAIKALGGPIVLLAGGRDKSGGFAQIENFIRKNTKACVLYGEARHQIAAAWPRVNHKVCVKDFAQAFKAALKLARSGDSVLLSPMCASFDQFDSYAHRGQVFKKLVRSL